MKKQIRAMLVVVFLSGCSLAEVVERGELCPGKANEGSLSYIEDRLLCSADKGSACQIGEKTYNFSENFELRVCPLDFPKCKTETVGEYTLYHCEKDTKTLTECPIGNVVCERDDGQLDCIDPSSNNTCGASTCDEESNYGGQNCTLYNFFSSCQQNSEGNYVCLCANGALQCNGECINPGSKITCGADDCSLPNYGGDDCTEYEDHRTCEEDSDGSYSCHCREGDILCNGHCVAPDSSDDFCGAKGKCNSSDPESEDYQGISCSSGDGFCHNGECSCGYGGIWCTVDDGETETTGCQKPGTSEICNVTLNEDGRHCDILTCPETHSCVPETALSYVCKLTNCADGDQICPIDGENACVSLHDPEHCGKCDINCHDGNYANFEVAGCEDTEDGSIACTYQCKGALTNCGNSFEPVCVDLMANVQNCGECGHGCSSKQYCDNGTCRATECRPNECTISNPDETNDCVNTVDKCGPNCISCKSVHPNGYCSDGVCLITTCNAGEHPVLNELGQITSCEKNRVESCGPVSITSNAEVVNCNQWKPGHATNAACTNEGKCNVTGCEVGYHVNPDKLSCASDTPTACGASMQDCTKIGNIANSSSVYCEQGVCRVSNCAVNFHLSGDQKSCVGNTTSACGATNSVTTTNCTGIANIASASSVSCNAGVCLVSACAPSYHIKSNRTGCEANSNSSCAPSTSNSPVNCSNNSVEKTCIPSTGKCACSSDGSKVLNYDGNACVIKACQGYPGVLAGELREYNYYSGSSVSDYRCYATSCNSGYKQYVSGSSATCRPLYSSHNPCTDLGYRYNTNCSGYCSAYSTSCNANSHNKCKDGYREYRLVCIESKYCCGTIDSSHGTPSTDYLCKNCVALGYSKCNTSTGQCTN